MCRRDVFGPKPRDSAPNPAVLFRALPGLLGGGHCVAAHAAVVTHDFAPFGDHRLSLSGCVIHLSRREVANR